MSGPLRTVELFAGIGGLALAAPDGFELVAAYDQDVDAAATHELNHGVPVLRKDLASIGADELARHEAAVWLLSPPCQPFTRRGRGRDIDDPRCRGFLRVVELLPRCRPERLLVENVTGFFGSRMHALLHEALRDLGHVVCDLEACPSELGAPVRRPRQFVLSSISGLVPSPGEPPPGPPGLSDCLDLEPSPALALPPGLRRRVADRRPEGGPIGTFTRSYGRALTGAGPLHWEGGRPRWFSPEELLRLHDFPAGFRFPPGLSRKRRWRLAGNSVHVGCVRHVARVLDTGEKTDAA